MITEVRHSNCNVPVGRYPGGASLTSVWFDGPRGVKLVLRRFWRADMRDSGRLELYIVAPDTGMEELFGYTLTSSPRWRQGATTTETPPRYLQPALDALWRAIRMADADVPADISQRYDAIELV